MVYKAFPISPSIPLSYTKSVMTMLLIILALLGLLIYLISIEIQKDRLDIAPYEPFVCCPSCSSPVEDTDYICSECKGSLSRECSNCRKTSFWTFNFCPFCGYSLVLPQESND